MADERRSTGRILASGVHVIYELASGERVEAAAEDLSSAGLFVQTVRNLAVGKRIALEIHIPGEADAWSAVGRVVWVRGEAETAAAGMGVKFIDIEDAACDAIDRMRARAEAPIIDDGGAEGDRARPALPFKLSTRKAPATSESQPKSTSLQAPATRDRSGWNWVAALVITVFAGVSIYVIFARATSGPHGVAAAPHAAVSMPLALPAPSPAAVAPSPADTTPPLLRSGDPSPPVPDGVALTTSAPARPAASRSTATPARPTPRSPSSNDASRTPVPAANDSANPY
jgi:uncharacterized protein (TIGR02266 family)